jgi:hypothetical protein
MEIDHRTRSLSAQQPNRWTGLLFGLLAGLTLLLAGWGFDGWELARSDGILPWAKTLLGAACVLLPLGLLVWLSIRIQHEAVLAGLWLAAGALFGWVAAQIAFRFFPWFLARWAPDAARFITYEYGYGPSGRGVLASISCGLIFFLAGILIHPLVDGWNRAIYPASRLLSILAWVGLFALCGAAVNSLVHRPLTEPIAVIDNLISFRLSDPAAMDTPMAKSLRASALNAVENLLPRRHRLVVASYDEAVTTVRVLVDFEGRWVECTLIGDQPIFCRPLE